MTDPQSPEWHPQAISPSTGTTLRELSRTRLLDDFYLAGGTGLALQFGHRISLDLDFFASGLFDEEVQLQRVQTQPRFALVSKAPHSLHASIQETKVSFLGYDYPLLYPTRRFLEAEVADTRDIACMKLSAIAGRGTKRDFVDVYACARRFGLAELLNQFHRKYSSANYNRVHLLKSLTYFEDAEKEVMPNMLIPLEWGEVKNFFLGEVPRFEP